ncbi:uncharacterized protein LOC131221858 isoform X2 [Magnolia sinica]|uniref:uncharacterized protein LOC131221858 isoform X2 n=2 Tax=Magnolia sinica TaxID=86752 RepID=UPI002659FD40|nr:uncharacterized protein LOC131221858 isoform X2 [Magnolia sinica]
MLSKKRKERGKICMNLYSPHELCTLSKFNEKLQKIKQYLHGIRSNIPPGLEDSIRGGAPDTKEKRLQWTSSAIDETKIYGWDKDVEEINKELIKEGTDLNKVGIVGMFGSGKSTLAQKIFVSEDVLDTFPLRLWVWVSPQCTKEELVRRMLDNLGVEEEEIEKTLEIDPTKNKIGVLLFILYLQLLDKRYLIVFDDVWNLDGWYCNLQDEPPEDKEWDHLAHGLPKGNGSAIIITSRKEDDARKMVGKGKIYTPKPLIGDDGWTLFKSAFEEEVNTLPAEDAKTLTLESLKDLKQEITIKCGGLPLALITAGKEMVHEKLKTERENVGMEMLQYVKLKDKNPVQDEAQAEKQKDKATVRDGEQADKQKGEDTVTGEGSGHSVRDGAQAGKQKAEDDHISEEGSSHADRDGAEAQKQNVEEGVAEESSRQTVRDRAQAEKKKEKVEKKKAKDAVAEESSGQTVGDRAQADKKKEEAEKKKTEDTVAEEGSGHAVRDGAQAEKQKAEEGSSHAVRDGAQAEKQKVDDAVEEGSDHDG